MMASGYMDTQKTTSSQSNDFIGKTLLSILKKHKKQQLENRMKYGKLYTIDSNAVCTKEDGELVTPSVVKWNTRRISNALSLSFKLPFSQTSHCYTSSRKWRKNERNL